MTAPRIVRGADLRPVPWRNGQGVTRDILAAPEGPDAWLISLADLERDAPFSHFPDADRTFTIVAGEGAELRFAAGAVRCPPLLPTFFPGEAAPACSLIGGPSRAFNLIVDRRRFRAGVAAMRLAPGAAARLGPETTAIFCVEGRLAVDGHALDAGDTLVGDAELVADEAALVVRVVVATL